MGIKQPLVALDSIEQHILPITQSMLLNYSLAGIMLRIETNTHRTRGSQSVFGRFQ